MARGGKRDGAGGKPQWKSGKTRTIRIPIVLAERILEIAKALDAGDITVVGQIQPESVIIDDDTASKTIDLSGISLVSISGHLGVRLGDLVRNGYIIKPKHLFESVSASLRRN